MDEDANPELFGLESTKDGKDGGSLRRPMNAFLIFCKKHRAIVREKNPHLDNRAVTRILGELWANLPTPEKESYLNIAKEYRDAFMKTNPDYRWHTSKKDTLPAFKAPASRPGLGTVSLTLQNGSERIVPGKLADPSNMGGLGLLLKAGGDNRSTNASPRLADPSPAVKTEPMERDTPVKEFHVMTKNDDPDFKNNKSAALLELAEMCSTQRSNDFTTTARPPIKTSPNPFGAAISNNHMSNPSPRVHTSFPVLKKETNQIAQNSKMAAMANSAASSSSSSAWTNRMASPSFSAANGSAASKQPIRRFPPNAQPSASSPLMMLMNHATAAATTQKVLTSSSKESGGVNGRETVAKSSNVPPRLPDAITRLPDSATGFNDASKLSGIGNSGGHFRSRSADTATEQRSKLLDAKNFISLEKVSLPMAMPLMVNKMIETVLCKELANDEAEREKLAKKLECTETLDDEPEIDVTRDRKRSQSGPDVDKSRDNDRKNAVNLNTASQNGGNVNVTLRRASDGGMQYADVRGVNGQRTVNDTQNNAASKPALTFSQIQETLIRKAMEDSRLVNVPAPATHKQLSSQGRMMSSASNAMEISTHRGNAPVENSNFSTNIINTAAKPESLSHSKLFNPAATAILNKVEHVETEPKPHIIDIPKATILSQASQGEHKRATLFDMLESRIKAEIKEEGRPQMVTNVKPNEAAILTCTEEFKDPDLNNSPSKPPGETQQNQPGLDKLRHQIETQLTSHLMANVGLPIGGVNNYTAASNLMPESGPQTNRGMSMRNNWSKASPTSDIQTKPEMTVANGNKSLPFNRRDETLLPPKKRGRNFIPQSDDHNAYHKAPIIQQIKTKDSNTNNTNLPSQDHAPNQQKTINQRNKISSKGTKTNANNTKSLVELNKGPAAKIKPNCDKDTKQASATMTTRRRRRHVTPEQSSNSSSENLSSYDGGEDVNNGNEEVAALSPPLNGTGSENENEAMTSLPPEEDGGEEDDSGVRKSKRRNRGQKYQELVSQGLLQVGRHKRTESTSESQDSATDPVGNGSSMLRRRKRTVSDSNGVDKMDASPPKRLVRGFDLDAHLAELPACRMADLKRDPVHRGGHLGSGSSRGGVTRMRQGGRYAANATSGSAMKLKDEGVKMATVAENKDLNIAQLRQSQLQTRDQAGISSSGSHVSGSQKRKQRRCPITHLHQLKAAEPSKALNTALENNNNNNTSSKPVTLTNQPLQLQQQPPINTTTTVSTNHSRSNPTSNDVKNDVSYINGDVISQAKVTSPPALNLNFAALVDVAAAELRQGNSKEITVSCT